MLSVRSVRLANIPNSAITEMFESFVVMQKDLQKVQYECGKII
jgi:hypothetical protein